MMPDLKKYEKFYERFMDEVEFKNYIELIRLGHEAGVVDDDKYKKILTDYIRTYEEK